MGTEKGSALIMVLWVLIMVGFLSEQYSIHNRNKAGLAANAWDRIKQKNAVESVLHLLATDSWPIPPQTDQAHAEAAQPDPARTWTRLSLDDIGLWIKAEKESGRINLNTDTEFNIREKIRELLGESRRDEADALADAIFDWRDADILIRTNGAEKDYYEEEGFSYVPANGSFNILTELLLVKGMNPDIFWGDPKRSIEGEDDEKSDENNENDGSEQTLRPQSFVEHFTIYPKDVTRISIIVEGKRKSYLFVLAYLKKEKAGWIVLRMHQAMLVS